MNPVLYFSLFLYFLDPESDVVTFTLSNPIMRGRSYQYNIHTSSLSTIQDLPLPPSAHIQEEQFDVRTEFIKSHDNQEIPTIFVSPKRKSSHSPILLSSYYYCDVKRTNDGV